MSIKSEDFFSVEHPEKTKFKFNMNAGDVNHPAWDYLINGEEDPDWIKMNAHKKKQTNNQIRKTN